MGESTLTLKDLNKNQCRWPTGSLRTGIFFCGKNTRSSVESYCPYHSNKSLSKNSVNKNH